MKTRKKLQTSAFSFIALNLKEKGVLNIFLIKERSTEQAADTVQCRALLGKVMETLKRSIFSLTTANLVNKLLFVITTSA